MSNNKRQTNMAPPKPKFAEGNFTFLLLKCYHNLALKASLILYLTVYLLQKFLLVFPGEKVLCFHGPLIYEAKCLKSSITKDKHVRYFIHYAGWNKK